MHDQFLDNFATALHPLRHCRGEMPTSNESTGVLTPYFDCAGLRWTLRSGRTEQPRRSAQTSGFQYLHPSTARGSAQDERSGQGVRPRHPGFQHLHPLTGATARGSAGRSVPLRSEQTERARRSARTPWIPVSTSFDWGDCAGLRWTLRPAPLRTNGAGKAFGPDTLDSSIYILRLRGAPLDAPPRSAQDERSGQGGQPRQPRFRNPHLILIGSLGVGHYHVNKRRLVPVVPSSRLMRED